MDFLHGRGDGEPNIKLPLMCYLFYHWSVSTVISFSVNTLSRSKTSYIIFEAQQTLFDPVCKYFQRRTCYFRNSSSYEKKYRLIIMQIYFKWTSLQCLCSILMVLQRKGTLCQKHAANFHWNSSFCIPLKLSNLAGGVHRKRCLGNLIKNLL